MVCTVTNEVPVVCEHTILVPVPCYKSLGTSCEHSILSYQTDNFSTTSHDAVKGLNPGVIKFYEPVEYDHAGDRSP